MANSIYNIGVLIMADYIKYPTNQINPSSHLDQSGFNWGQFGGQAFGGEDFSSSVSAYGAYARAITSMFSGDSQSRAAGLYGAAGQYIGGPIGGYIGSQVGSRLAGTPGHPHTTYPVQTHSNNPVVKDFFLNIPGAEFEGNRSTQLVFNRRQKQIDPFLKLTRNSIASLGKQGSGLLKMYDDAIKQAKRGANKVYKNVDNRYAAQQGYLDVLDLTWDVLDKTLPDEIKKGLYGNAKLAAYNINKKQLQKVNQDNIKHGGGIPIGEVVGGDEGSGGQKAISDFLKAEGRAPLYTGEIGKVANFQAPKEYRDLAPAGSIYSRLNGFAQKYLGVEGNVKEGQLPDIYHGGVSATKGGVPVPRDVLVGRQTKLRQSFERHPSRAYKKQEAKLYPTPAGLLQGGNQDIGALIENYNSLGTPQVEAPQVGAPQTVQPQGGNPSSFAGGSTALEAQPPDTLGATAFRGDSVNRDNTFVTQRRSQFA